MQFPTIFLDCPLGEETTILINISGTRRFSDMRMLTDDSCSVSGLPIPSPASDDRQIIDSQIDRFISYMEVLPSLKTKSTKTTKRSFTYFEKGNTTKICW